MNSDKTRSAEVCAWIAFGLTSFCALFMLGMVAWTRARFLTMFSDLDVDLPQTTMLALGWVFLAIPVAVVVVALIKELAIRNKAATMLIDIILLSGLIFAVTVYMFALLLPLIPMTPRTG